MHMQTYRYPYVGECDPDSKDALWFNLLHNALGAELRFVEQGFGIDSMDMATAIFSLIYHNASTAYWYKRGEKPLEVWIDPTSPEWQEPTKLDTERSRKVFDLLSSLGFMLTRRIGGVLRYRLDYKAFRRFLDAPLLRGGWPPTEKHAAIEEEQQRLELQAHVLKLRTQQHLLERGFWLSAFDMADTLARLEKHADEGAIGEWHDLEMEGCYGREAEDLVELGLLERKEAGQRIIYRLDRKAYRAFASAPFSRGPTTHCPEKISSKSRH